MKEDIIKVGIICFMEHDIRSEPILRYGEIKNDLETLQGIVGGDIEMPYLSQESVSNGICIVINESGKLLDLKPTMIILNKKTLEVVDTIMGSVIFASYTEEGDLCSLSDEQIEYINKNIGNNISLLFEENGASLVFIHEI